MAPPNSLEADQRANFRAPPPSPVHSGRRSTNANDEFLTGFLEHSLHVPPLVLPDAVFPKHRRIAAPPVIDLRSPGSIAEAIAEALSETGCFQVSGMVISSEMARAAAAGIFAVPAERRTAAVRSPEIPYGFEGESGDLSEEFVWSVDQGLNSLMEGIWPLRYPHFRKQMEILLAEIEKVGEKLLSVICLNNKKTKFDPKETPNLGRRGTICCLYKNNKISLMDKDRDTSESLRHDVIRKLVRRDEYSHALCLHICGGSSEFHVYSKKGWFSFRPHKHALVVTIGDQIQTWSGGKYKNVVGRPIFIDDDEEYISMAILYSPSNTISSNAKYPQIRSESIIYLNEQVILALLLCFIYQFLAYVCHFFTD